MKNVIFACFLLLSILGFQKAEATDTHKYEVTAIFIQNNSIQKGVRIQSKNYDLAYRKLKQGKLTEKDFKAHQAVGLQDVYDVDNDKVTFREFQFGKGVVLTQEQTFLVIKDLYQKVPDFLNLLNKTDDGKKAEMHTFNAPGRTNWPGTDDEGKAVAVLEGGVNLFTNNSNSSIKVLSIENKATVYVGNSIVLPNNEVSLPEENLNKLSKQYSASYGDKVTYTLAISGDKAKFKNLSFTPSPNFVVDKVSVPYTIENLTEFKEKLDKNSYLTEDDYDTLGNKVGFLSYKIDISSDIQNIFVEGHVASQAERLLYFDDNGDVIQENISVKNTSLSQGICFSFDGEDGKNYLYTPQVYSYGINFVSYDASKNKLTMPSDYVLGRKSEDGTTEIYDGSSWKKAASKSGKCLTFGKIVNMDGNVLDIPMTTRLFGYDKTQNQKENQSLLQLRGLSGNYTYYLYQIKPRKGFKTLKKAIKFEVNGDSVKKAQFSNYQINGLIPDNVYGQNEYNAIQELRINAKVNNTRGEILFPIIILSAVILACLIMTVMLVTKKENMR